MRAFHFSQEAGRIGIACNSLESGFLVGKMELDFLGFSRVKRAFSKGREATLRLTNCQDPHRQQPVEADAADG